MRTGLEEAAKMDPEMLLNKEMANWAFLQASIIRSNEVFVSLFKQVNFLWSL